MGQSCILEKLMVKSNPDKNVKRDDFYHGDKIFAKNALFTNHVESKFHEKKLSESTHSSMNKNELSRQKFL